MPGGSGIRLRRLTRDDLERRLEMVNDPELQRLNIGVPADPNTLEELQSWFHMLSEDPYSEQWAIETAEGRYIGDFDLHSIDAARGRAWLSSYFGDKDYLGDDVRREAYEAILRYALHDKGLSRITITLPTTDRQGIALLEDLGFRAVEEAELDIFEGVNEVTLDLAAGDFAGRPR